MKQIFPLENKKNLLNPLNLLTKKNRAASRLRGFAST
jgi:hypothetical protein